MLVQASVRIAGILCTTEAAVTNCFGIRKRVEQNPEFKSGAQNHSTRLWAKLLQEIRIFCISENLFIFYGD